MTPEISEFSYGFALTNELVGWAPLAAAPVFPSLIEEGKSGGGYDVRLDMAGVALYLQFKRADCMKRRSAKEISAHGLSISLPFYRFKITETGKSDQHELLLALNEVEDLVFYAAPRFHELSEINEAWHANRVADGSIFVSPGAIGPLDDESHHVAYDEHNAWLCSEPKPLDFLGSAGLLKRMQVGLVSDSRSLRQKLPEMSEKLASAKRRAQERIFDRGAKTAVTEVPGFRFRPRADIPLRSPRPLSEDQNALREIADEAAQLFNTQLIVVQRRD
jgi:hypothetical protein